MYMEKTIHILIPLALKQSREHELQQVAASSCSLQGKYRPSLNLGLQQIRADAWDVNGGGCQAQAVMCLV